MKTKTQICQDIISTVANLFGITTGMILSRQRFRKVVDARFISMWLCKHRTGWPDRRVAGLFGKERSSIAYAIKKVPEWRETDPVFRELFEMASERVAVKPGVPVEGAGAEPIMEIPINHRVAVRFDLPHGWSFTPDTRSGVAGFAHQSNLYEAGNASEGKDTATT